MLPVGAALKQIKLAIAAYFLHMIQYHRHSTGIRIISRVIATFLEICRDVLHHTPVLLDSLEHDLMVVLQLSRDTLRRTAR